MCRLSEITAIQLKTNDSAAADSQIDRAKKSGGTRFTRPKQGRANQTLKDISVLNQYVGQNCRACDKRNHFKHMGRSTSEQGTGKPRKTKKVHELGLETEDDDPFFGELFIGELSVDTCYKSPWIKTIRIQYFLLSLS